MLSLSMPFSTVHLRLGLGCSVFFLGGGGSLFLSCLLSEGGLSKVHNSEGRVIVLEYPSVTVVALYVPNNGAKDESFERR